MGSAERVMAGLQRASDARWGNILYENASRPITHGEPSMVLACRTGCSACCVNVVESNTVECQAIAAHVEQSERRQEVVERLFDWVAEWKGFIKRNPFLPLANNARTIARWQVRQKACPFLTNNLCGIYEHRPLACRAHHAVYPPEGVKAPVPPTVCVTTDQEARSGKLRQETWQIGDLRAFQFRSVTETFDALHLDWDVAVLGVGVLEAGRQTYGWRQVT